MSAGRRLNYARFTAVLPGTIRTHYAGSATVTCGDYFGRRLQMCGRCVGANRGQSEEEVKRYVGIEYELVLTTSKRLRPLYSRIK